MELATSFRVNEAGTTAATHVLASGEVNLQFKSEHVDESGAPIRIPNMFLIQSPVFRNGIAYRIPVRLRYRVKSGSVSFAIARLRPERYFDDALTDAIDDARNRTAVPFMRGAPEA